MRPLPAGVACMRPLVLAGGATGAGTGAAAGMRPLLGTVGARPLVRAGDICGWLGGGGLPRPLVEVAAGLRPDVPAAGTAPWRPLGRRMSAI